MSSQQLFGTGTPSAASAQQTFNPVEGAQMLISGPGSVTGVLTVGGLNVTGSTTEGPMTTSSLHVTGTSALDGTVTCGTVTSGTNPLTCGDLSAGTSGARTLTLGNASSTASLLGTTTIGAGAQPVTINGSTMQFTTGDPTPSTAAGRALGTSALPWASLWLGSAASLSSQELYIDLTSATYNATQINAMPGAPQNIIGAPGANKLIIVDAWRLSATFGSLAFASGSSLQLIYTGGPAAVAVINSAFLTTFSVNQWAQGNRLVATTVPNSTSVNKGIDFTVLSTSFTTGTGCTVGVQVRYRIVNV